MKEKQKERGTRKNGKKQREREREREKQRHVAVHCLRSQVCPMTSLWEGGGVWRRAFGGGAHSHTLLKRVPGRSAH